MKRITTTAIATALLAGAVSAQGMVYVPSNTPNTGVCNGAPMGQTEVRYQTIIDESYLPDAELKITDIAFAPCNTTGMSMRQLQVRMCHTTLTAFPSANVFDNNLTPCPTDLINGPHRWSATANTWSPLGLPCDFGYDGRRNLLIEIRYAGATGGTSCRRDTVVPRMYRTGTGSYSTLTGNVNSLAGLKLQILYSRTCVMLAPDTVSIGSTMPVDVYNAPSNQNIQVAASLGQSPFNAGSHLVCLTPDPVFLASIVVGPPVFNGYAGLISSGGRYSAKFAPPALRSLVGLCVYHAAVAYDRSGILCATNTVGTQLTP